MIPVAAAKNYTRVVAARDARMANVIPIPISLFPATPLLTPSTPTSQPPSILLFQEVQVPTTTPGLALALALF